MPTYAVSSAFVRMITTLTREQREQFYRARDLFVAELKAHGFAPLCIRRCAYTSSQVTTSGRSASVMVCERSLHWGARERGEVHIVWEFIGTHNEHERLY